MSIRQLWRRLAGPFSTSLYVERLPTMKWLAGSCYVRLRMEGTASCTQYMIWYSMEQCMSSVCRLMQAVTFPACQTMLAIS